MKGGSFQRGWVGIGALLMALALPAQETTSVSAQQELEAVTQPKVGVVLAAFDKSAPLPVFVTLVAQTGILYYSLPGTQCRGKEIWSLAVRAAGPATPAKVSDMACVTNLLSDGISLYVGTKEGNRDVLKQWDGKEGLSLEEALLRIQDRHLMKWKFDLYADKTNSDQSLFALGDWLHLQWQPGRAVRLIHTTAAAPTQLAVFSFSLLPNETTRPAISIPLDRPRAQMTRAAFYGPDQMCLLQKPEPGLSPRMEIMSVSTGKVQATIGGNNVKGVVPAPETKRLPLESWMPFEITDMVGLRNGVVIADKGPARSEGSLNYLAWEEKEKRYYLYPVPATPPDRMDQLSSVYGGLLMVLENERVIFWMGRRSPFSVQKFPIAKSSLQEMSRGEYRSLVGGR